MRTRQMDVFLFLLAASWVVDYRRYSLSRPTGTPEGLLLVATLLVFGALLFHVGSRRAVLAASLAALVALALDPHLSNHETLYVAVMIAVPAAWVATAARDRTLRVDAGRFDASLATTLRLVFLVSYGWAAFHKWNSDFLDPAKSCAVYQVLDFSEKLPVIPVPQALLALAAPATLAVELAIPLGLALPRTRRVAILVALGFHTLLGIGFPAFQLLVFGFLALFVPEPVWRDVFARVSRPQWLAPPLARIATGLAVAIAVGELYTFTLHHPTLLGQRIFPAAMLASLAAVAAWSAWRVLRNDMWRAAAPVSLARGLPAALWLLPLAVFAQGLQPHLGVKAVQSFAMFSNLDTDGGRSNHWILPASLQLSSALADTVIVRDASHPQIRALASKQRMAETVLRAETPPRLRPSYLALRRTVTELARAGETDLSIDFWHAGRRRVVANAERDPALADASFVERVYLKTRPIAMDGSGACRW